MPLVAQVQNLPVLTVIYNNPLYGAVRRATLDMYGKAWRPRRMDGCSPTCQRPAFERWSRPMAAMASASKAGRPPGRAARAAEAVRGGQQALVNVICPP